MKGIRGGAETWLRLQAAYDLARAMKRADKIKVERVMPAAWSPQVSMDEAFAHAGLHSPMVGTLYFAQSAVLVFQPLRLRTPWCGVQQLHVLGLDEGTNLAAKTRKSSLA